MVLSYFGLSFAYFGRDGGVLTGGDVDNIRNMLFDADAGGL